MLHNGQHYDAEMSDQFFVELGIREPAFHLGITPVGALLIPLRGD